MKRKKRVWIIPIAIVLVLAIGAAGVFFIREEIRAARQREAENFRFRSASLHVNTPVSEPGTPVTFTAEADGGKGVLLYEFYYFNKEEKVVVQEASEQNSLEFTSPGYRLYDIFVSISDESAMTADITAECRYGAAHKGVDVSVYQKSIDWSKVKAEGYDFAMIRTGFGWSDASQTDANFAQNMQGALNAGLKVGAYHFSYAMTPEEAKKEAEFCLSILEPYKDLIDYPIAFDIETDEHQNLTEAELTAIVEAFCSEIKQAGYTPIVYTYDSWLGTHAGWAGLQHYDFWVANWLDAPSADYEYAIWQYSNSGRVNGVEENIDLNYAFTDYEKGKKIS